MSDINQYDIVPIEELKTKLETYKYNPTIMQRVILDTLSDVTNGKINIVDPTNPFVFLLEASVVNASLFIQENYLNLRRQYPSLAQTQEEIYLHMCDKDYIGRFATSGKCIFTVAISHKDLINAPYDASMDANKLTIPKDTEVQIDNIKYTFSYAIDVIRYSNNIIKVQYVATEQNPLMPLSNSLINYTARKNADGDIWVFFDIELLQLQITSTQFPIDSGYIFNKTIPYIDQYTYCRVYYKNTATLEKWTEILTTHNELVHDIHTPTAVLKVSDHNVNIKIPAIYTNQNIISGTIKVDIFTTKGNMTVDLSNYKLSAFNNTLRSLGDDSDINNYVTSLSNSSYLIFSDKISTGGNDGIDLSTLRKRVINNATGDRQIPISNVQLESYVENQGFELIKNIDLVTNRVFLATRKLPNPSNRKVITPATLGLSSIVINPIQLANNYNVVSNYKMLTIKSNSLFKLDNGILKIMSSSDINYLNALPTNDYISNINSNNYYYNPYYYVYDENNKTEYDLRVYHLDQPKINHINFLNQNDTLQIAVNTGSMNIEKTIYGYKISIETKSGSFYKQLADNRVALQLAYYPKGETKLAYINAVQTGLTTSGERLYEIELRDNLSINEDDELTVNNACMFNSSPLETKVDLTHTYYLIYSTDSITTNFQPSSIDNKIFKPLLTEYFKGITEEQISISLGYNMKNLWSKIRPIISDLIYKRHTTDIPLLYNTVVYETDPVTGSIFHIDPITNELVYNILHNINDPVLDEEGDPVYKHKIGDIILDNSGEPIIEGSVSLSSEIDILLVDARYLLANNAIYKDYRSSISDLIHTWCSVNIENIQNLLLEQTKIYFYPKTTFTNIETQINKSNIANLQSEVYFKIKLFLKSSIVITNDLKSSITESIITILDNYLNNKIISIDDIIILIRNKFSSIIDSVQIRGLNDNTNLYNLEIMEDHKRFNLKKKIVLESDKNIYVIEDVDVEFLLSI